MILGIEQLNKKLYEADFQIRRGKAAAGRVTVKGMPGQMEADIRLELLGKQYVLSCEGNHHAPSKEKRRPEQKETAYRTYLISGEKAGRICQIKRKTGMFSAADFQELQLGNQIFYKYVRVFQTEGKHSVYARERQIAQVDTSSEIIDDMHRYKIYAADSESAEIAALFCAYGYLLTGFRPGQEIRKGYYKQASVSFDKTFADRYHPDFIRSIEP